MNRLAQMIRQVEKMDPKDLRRSLALKRIAQIAQEQSICSERVRKKLKGVA